MSVSKLTDEQIDEGLRLASEATAGEWWVLTDESEAGTDYYVLIGDQEDRVASCYEGECKPNENAAFIAAARTLLPAALNELKALRVRKWQDISTAPKDGTRVLLCVVHSGFVGDEREYYHMASWALDHWQPFIPNNWTHWMPLPDPPSDPQPTERSP